MTLGPIVDTHVHFWDLEGGLSYPWLTDPGSENWRWNYLPQQWRDDAHELDVVATVHVQAEMDHDDDPVKETAWLAQLGEQQPEAPLPTVCVGYADLRAPDLADVLDRHQRFSLFRGVRQEAWFDPDSTRRDVLRTNLLDDPAWIAGLSILARRELSFDLLVWAHQLKQAAGVFRELPDLTVILEHTGVPADPSAEARAVWREGMRDFAEQVPNSVLKISGLIFVSETWSLDVVEPVVREAIEIFGPSRCMFGSNFPVDRPAVSYGELWSAYDEITSDLSASERATMFSELAARIYRIDLAREAA